jgi:hypothetical protein
MPLDKVRNSKTANGGELIEDRHGNSVPKNKLIDDVNHAYNRETGEYEPATPADSIRKSVVKAGSSLWKMVSGK